MNDMLPTLSYVVTTPRDEGDTALGITNARGALKVVLALEL